MKYVVEIGSGAMIYINTGSSIQKLMGGGDSQTHKAACTSHKPI